VSQQEVEIVRLYVAVADRDAATVLSLYDSEIEWDDSRLPEAKLTGRTAVRGHDAIRGVFREWYEAWDSYEDRCGELIDAGEHVISVVTRRGRGRASGADASSRRAGVWTICDGRIVRAVWFSSVEEARAAAGLSE
jgi:ketosteroid isomerase-like protein